MTWPCECDPITATDHTGALIILHAPNCPADLWYRRTITIRRTP
jgi:hypothetical protein